VRKLLILSLIFLSGIATGAEVMDRSDGEILEVWVKLVLFDTQAELAEKYTEMYPHDPEDHTLQGFSICDRFLKRDYDVETEFAECTVYQLRPTVVDGEHTVTLGHEVWHGVYGPDYHEVVE